MTKFNDGEWKTVSDGALYPDTMYMMSEHEIVTIRNFQGTIKAHESTIGALKDTIECLHKSLQSSVPKWKYDQLKERLQTSNECWERNQDYWFDETRKAEAEVARLKMVEELISKSTEEWDYLRSSLKTAIDLLILVRKGVTGVNSIIDSFLVATKKIP